MLCGIGPHEWLSEITLQQREQQVKLLDIYIYIYIYVWSNMNLLLILNY